MIDFSKRFRSKDKSQKTNPFEIYDSLDRVSATSPLRPIQKNS